MTGRKVLVAVSPRLLSDTLCRSLAGDGLPVVAIETAEPSEQYSVALVSPGREGEVRADHVIAIPAQDEDGDIDLDELRTRLRSLVQRTGD